VYSSDAKDVIFSALSLSRVVVFFFFFFVFFFGRIFQYSTVFVMSFDKTFL